eukprot:6005162-Heterocapsa_arctica.AAC.1
MDGLMMSIARQSFVSTSASASWAHSSLRGATSYRRGILCTTWGSGDTSVVEGGDLLISPLETLDDRRQGVLVLTVEDVVVGAGVVVGADGAPCGPQVFAELSQRRGAQGYRVLVAQVVDQRGP